MKKIIPFTISLALISGIVHAQQTGSAGETSGNNPEMTTPRRGIIIPISEMDQRKIYKWGTGQRATPSGRQAGDPHAKYARVFGDSAVVVRPSERSENGSYTIGKRNTAR